MVNEAGTAFEYWNGGKSFDAGKLIFEALPNALRPRWASRILRLLLVKSGTQSPLFDPVMLTAEQPSRWSNGHRVFSKVRAEVLRLDELLRQDLQSKEQKLHHALLCFAELVMKVTYNATSPFDEFDEDSGWWIVACLRAFVDVQWKDEEFANAAWTAACWRGDT